MCPDSVRQAKQIQALIDQKADFAIEGTTIEQAGEWAADLDDVNDIRKISFIIIIWAFIG